MMQQTIVNNNLTPEYERDLVYIEDIPDFLTEELMKFLIRYEDELEFIKTINRPYFDSGYWYDHDDLDASEKMVDSIRDELEKRGVYV